MRQKSALSPTSLDDLGPFYPVGVPVDSAENIDLELRIAGPFRAELARLTDGSTRGASSNRYAQRILLVLLNERFFGTGSVARASTMRKHMLLAGALFVLDALVLNQGAISSVVLLLVLLGFLPVALYRLIRHSDRQMLARSLVYAGASLLVFAANYLNNRIADLRAIELIAVIERYKLDTGAYPLSLEALVPAYLDHVPRAKYAVMSAEFAYQSQPGPTTLSYMELPPFGRPTYDFDERIWFYLD